MEEKRKEENVLRIERRMLIWPQGGVDTSLRQKSPEVWKTIQESFPGREFGKCPDK